MILSLLVFLSACGGNSSSAIIDDAGLYVDPSGIHPTTTYGWLDVFYCVIHVSGATPDTAIKASWVAADTSRAEPDTVLKIEEKQISSSVVLSRMNLYLNFIKTQ